MIKQKRTLPAPTGLYPVGLRHMAYPVYEEGNKTLLSLTVYYPAEPDSGEDFAAYACDEILEPLGIKEAIVTRCKENAEISHHGPFPLILFNHGYLTYEMCNTVLCTELASHGFIVAAIGHTGEAIVTMPDGEVIPKAQRYVDMVYNPDLDERVGEVIANIERLKLAPDSNEELRKLIGQYHKIHDGNLNERAKAWQYHTVKAAEFLLNHKNEFASFIDLQRGIGLTGHSFGGATAANCCTAYDIFSCGINMDGAQIGSSYNQSIGKPFMCMSGTDEGLILHEMLTKNKADTYHAVFPGVEHMGFTDKGILGTMFEKSLPGVGKQEPQVVSHAVSMLHLQFFKKYLAGAEIEIDSIKANGVDFHIIRKTERELKRC